MPAWVRFMWRVACRLRRALRQTDYSRVGLSYRWAIAHFMGASILMLTQQGIVRDAIPNGQLQNFAQDLLFTKLLNSFSSLPINFFILQHVHNTIF